MLQHARKRNTNMNDYLALMKNFADNQLVLKI